MPDPDYMDRQNGIHWTQRLRMVDRLICFHTHYALLPETLWIAVNIMDRFLSKKVVSPSKLSLVGMTALFIAAKYEERVAPKTLDFVWIDNQYSKAEIVAAERSMLRVSIALSCPYRAEIAIIICSRVARAEIPSRFDPD